MLTKGMPRSSSNCDQFAGATNVNILQDEIRDLLESCSDMAIAQGSAVLLIMHGNSVLQIGVVRGAADDAIFIETSEESAN